MSTGAILTSLGCHILGARISTQVFYFALYLPISQTAHICI
jgi:hypothetical protein